MDSAMSESENIIDQNEISLDNWSSLTPEEQVVAFQKLSYSEADHFFLALSARDQAILILALPASERRLWMRLLPPDDATDLIQETPEEERPALLILLDEYTRREVLALLAYKEDDAGGLMSPRFPRLRPDMTIDEAIAYLRRQAEQVETIHYAYVSIPNSGFSVSFRCAVCSRQIANRPCATSCGPSSSPHPRKWIRKRLQNCFPKQHLLAIPVIDEEGRMKGIVTVDDIVNVVTEEASEDIQKIGGMEALDAPYLQIGMREMVRKRGGWLAALFLGEMLTATAMGYFEKEIGRAVVLALFVPLIISSGGNSGSQATTSRHSRHGTR